MSIVTYNHLQAQPGPLAERETRYLLGLAQGLSRKEVARDCGVSPNTVAGATKRILYKLNAVKTADAISRAWASGLIRHLTVFLVLATLIAAEYDTQKLTARTPTKTARANARRSREDMNDVFIIA